MLHLQILNLKVLTLFNTFDFIIGQNLRMSVDTSPEVFIPTFTENYGIFPPHLVVHYGIAKHKDFVILRPSDDHVRTLLAHVPAGDFCRPVVEAVITNQRPATFCRVIKLDKTFLLIVTSVQSDLWVIVPV